MQLTKPIICLITDRTLAGPRGLDEDVAAAVASGVNLVQVREKDLPTRALLDLAMRLRAVCQPQAALMINGRADVAFASQAEGVHLPSDGLPTAGARAVLGATALVGRSVHSAEEARAVAPDALDYVELGTIFPSRSHPGGQTLGLDAIRGAAGCGVPIVAVGGITPENAGAVIAAGADGVAVITAILGQRDPGAAAARLCEAAQTAWSQRELTPSPSGR